MVLSGCSTLPQKMKFPVPPDSLMQEPQKMDLLKSKTDSDSNDSESGLKLSEIAKSITENYNKYHQLELQLQSLQQWIKDQENIYNGSN